MALERVGIGAGFIGAHTGALLAVSLQDLEHRLHMLSRIHCTQSREYMKTILAELDAVIAEAGLALWVTMAAEDTVTGGNSDDPVHRRQGLYLGRVEGFGVANEVDFGKRLLLSGNFVVPDINAGQLAQIIHGQLVFGTGFVDIRVKDNEHFGEVIHYA
jgi:hypothetical protein